MFIPKTVYKFSLYNLMKVYTCTKSTTNVFLNHY